MKFKTIKMEFELQAATGVVVAAAEAIAGGSGAGMVTRRRARTLGLASLGASPPSAAALEEEEEDAEEARPTSRRRRGPSGGSGAAAAELHEDDDEEEEDEEPATQIDEAIAGVKQTPFLLDSAADVAAGECDLMYSHNAKGIPGLVQMLGTLRRPQASVGAPLSMPPRSLSGVTHNLFQCCQMNHAAARGGAADGPRGGRDLLQAGQEEEQNDQLVGTCAGGSVAPGDKRCSTR